MRKAPVITSMHWSLIKKRLIKLLRHDHGVSQQTYKRPWQLHQRVWECSIAGLERSICVQKQVGSIPSFVHTDNKASIIRICTAAVKPSAVPNLIILQLCNCIFCIWFCYHANNCCTSTERQILWFEIISGITISLDWVTGSDDRPHAWSCNWKAWNYQLSIWSSHEAGSNICLFNLNYHAKWDSSPFAIRMSKMTIGSTKALQKRVFIRCGFSLDAAWETIKNPFCNAP